MRGREAKRASRPGTLLLLATALAALSCKPPEPAVLLTLLELETHWAVDRPSAGMEYIAPVVRFKLHNQSKEAQTSVQTTAVFKRKGEESQTWGSDYAQAASREKPLPAGQDVLVMMKSDARYNSPGTPDSMFTHALFKDAVVDVFVRVGSSAWVKFATADVERRIGSRAAQEIVGTPMSVPAASPRP